MLLINLVYRYLGSLGSEALPVGLQLAFSELLLVLLVEALSANRDDFKIPCWLSLDQQHFAGDWVFSRPNSTVFLIFFEGGGTTTGDNDYSGVARFFKLPIFQ